MPNPEVVVVVAKPTVLGDNVEEIVAGLQGGPATPRSLATQIKLYRAVKENVSDTDAHADLVRDAMDEEIEGKVTELINAV
jgi:hypothetical protein|tara:strand:- start:271 stop:513 length:243 start_codon:yes stop_codon:yes gene_type:complete